MERSTKMRSRHIGLRWICRSDARANAGCLCRRQSLVEKGGRNSKEVLQLANQADGICVRCDKAPSACLRAWLKHLAPLSDASHSHTRRKDCAFVQCTVRCKESAEATYDAQSKAITARRSGGGGAESYHLSATSWKMQVRER